MSKLGSRLVLVALAPWMLGSAPLGDGGLPGVGGLGETEWSVRVVPGAHGGPYHLKVTVEPEGDWPRVDGKLVEYGVSVRSPGGDVRKVGWIRESLRSLSTPVRLGNEAILVGLDWEAVAEWARERDRRFDAAMQAIAEATPDDPPSTGHLEILDDELALILPREIEQPPALLWEYEILLSPQAGGADLRQEGAKTPERRRYLWGTEVTNPMDPCFGRTPEVCVLERLQAIRARLCNELNAQGSPRFFFECIVFALKLSSEPPKIEVKCDLESAAASTVPSDDHLPHIHINGEHFLTGDCLEATILHEIQHVFDMAAGRLRRTNELRQLAKVAERAKEKLREILEEEPRGDNWIARLRGAMAELETARTAVRDYPHKKEVTIERIRTECGAYLVELANRDFVGSPDQTRAWVVHNIQVAFEQVLVEAGRHGVGITDPEVRAAMCECLRRLREWLRQNPDVEQVMREQKNPYGGDDSWLQLIETMISGLCQ